MMISDYQYRPSSWRKWFAWHPIRIQTCLESGYDLSHYKVTWVWLEAVERREDLWDGGWEYRIPPRPDNHIYYDAIWVRHRAQEAAYLAAHPFPPPPAPPEP